MKNIRRQKTNIVLMLGALLICFIITEVGYRIFAPFPHFSRFIINVTQHGNLSTYDEILGWRGIPSGQAEFVTINNKVWLAHNRYGFRDIDHSKYVDKKPAIVFLGDSFTWGFEVEFEEMFVNRMRDMFQDYEIFNLAHRGYGTDQSLLTFKGWHSKHPLELVVLMFCENDVEDNNAISRYCKLKPKYQLVEDRLVLMGIPVPKDNRWEQPPSLEDASKLQEIFFSRKTIIIEYLKQILFSSHFLHDVYFRCRLLICNNNNSVHIGKNNEPDLTLTVRILEELKKEVERRNAKLVVGLIPSKREIEKLDTSPPYQVGIAGLCQQLDIEYLDLAPHFKNTWLRTYYRQGMHWNAHGHKIAAKALSDFITKNVVKPSANVPCKP